MEDINFVIGVRNDGKACCFYVPKFKASIGGLIQSNDGAYYTVVAIRYLNLSTEEEIEITKEACCCTEVETPAAVFGRITMEDKA